MNEKKRRHVTTDKLLDWIEGRLSNEAVAKIQQQMTAADKVELAWLEQFHQRVSRIDFVSPPEAAREAIRQQFGAMIKPKEKETLWQRFTANLKRDSLDDSGHVGLAGARDARLNHEPQMNQRMFTTDVAHIMIDIIPDGDQFTLDGQIFPQSDALSDQFVIQMVQDDQSIALVTSDDLGEFTLSHLKAGTYAMVLCHDAIEIEIPNVELIH